MASLRPADLIRIVRDTSLGDWIYQSYNWAVPLLFFKADGTPVIGRCNDDGNLLVAAAPGSGAPGASGWGTGSVTTSATGSDFAPISSIAAKKITILNDTGADLEIQKAGSGSDPVLLPDGNGTEINLVANTNEVTVRRVDQSSTQVTATFQYET